MHGPLRASDCSRNSARSQQDRGAFIGAVDTDRHGRLDVGRLAARGVSQPHCQIVAALLEIQIEGEIQELVVVRGPLGPEDPSQQIQLGQASTLTISTSMTSVNADEPWGGSGPRSAAAVKAAASTTAAPARCVRKRWRLVGLILSSGLGLRREA